MGPTPYTCQFAIKIRKQGRKCLCYVIYVGNMFACSFLATIKAFNLASKIPLDVPFEYPDVVVDLSRPVSMEFLFPL